MANVGGVGGVATRRGALVVTSGHASQLEHRSGKRKIEPSPPPSSSRAFLLSRSSSMLKLCPVLRESRATVGFERRGSQNSNFQNCGTQFVRWGSGHNGLGNGPGEVSL
eukprot:2781139-Rhodomonas_salina.2